jgi:putative ABC transport system ATP-binding protein
MIRVRDLRKVYRSGDEEVEALRGVSLDIPDGACVFIVGPSGSGKTTLLHLLGALDAPTAGTITVDGRDLTTMGEIELDAFRRDRIGFVFQQFHLISNLTAVGNVLMPFIPTGIPPELRTKAESLLGRMGLQHRLTHRPSRLSGGQQQRVAIARALIKDPSLLLADEPTGNLDHRSADEIFALLRIYRRELNCTLIVVTHDRRFIRPDDQIIEIEDGRIASEPNPSA